MEAVFKVEGNQAVPSEHAAGPWDPTMQHGGAPASLVAWAAESIATAVPMRVARLTIDLLRPVPLAPLEIDAQVVREGRKIQVSSVRLLAKGTEVVRASVLKIRETALPLPDAAAAEPVTFAGPEEGREVGNLSVNPFLAGLSLRAVKGDFFESGPGAIWFRANRPMLEGIETTPLMRAALTADFCNGVSSVLDIKNWTYINGDLTISLARMPVGEWVLLDAETWFGDEGRAIAFGKLGDRNGYFGRAVQSLVLEKR